MKDNMLIVKGVKVLFVEIKDKDFGSNVTIDVTDDAIRSQIEAFYTANGMNPKFKEFTSKDGKTTKQFSIKLASFISVQDEDGVTYEGIDALEEIAKSIRFVYGSEINLAIKSYEYNNKFGAGKSASVSAIRIVKGAETKSVMAELA